MRRFYLLLFLFVTGMHLRTVAGIPTLTGTWTGTVQTLHPDAPDVAFEISQATGGSLTAVMHVTNQQNYNIPVDSILQNNQQVRMVISRLSCRFEGALVNDTLLKGFIVMNDQQRFVLELKKQAALPAPKTLRPQEPVGPLPYLEENVRFPHAAAGITLSGTLSWPATGGRFPAVVLISGSGGNDRDANIFTHKVFLVLADYLTRAGIAVLRVDDRGIGESTGDFDSATNEDLAADAVAGVAYLHTRKEINPKAIGLIGHSLGGDIAPIAANLSPDVNFIVLMAGSAAPIATCYYEHCAAAYPLEGVSPKGVQVNQLVLAAVFNIIQQQPSDSIARVKIPQVLRTLDKAVAGLSAKDQDILDLHVPIASDEFLTFLSKPRRADFQRDQFAIVSRVKCPVLAINGTKDVQVLPSQLKRIERALRQGGNKQVTIKAFEGKNHLFQTAKTGAISEYATITETMAPEVMAFMASWIQRTTAL
ncbi:alpha/beta hydrolase family protein [Chitinophaga nivalis]|uniref:Alpha/beta fold hydrolase n=1 Tax=Chitinophaga nivalis TaxID=2991709 RepID=A0ABT3IJZ4_9BACT|nr:alpha/beta fold hydrolase [Chitinophaga nivalis]MCW3466017.1 alpha/beta fold hydrolase [Chitinophaga nivalis]MCW3484292.1 alpha/beta fold hydrolase [Chitinophaga nivalis]